MGDICVELDMADSFPYKQKLEKRVEGWKEKFSVMRGKYLWDY